MKDMQQTLDAFFRIEPKTRKVKKEKSEVLITRAKEVLEPLFIRPVPEDSRYRRQLDEEYELIDKNHF